VRIYEIRDAAVAKLPMPEKVSKKKTAAETASIIVNAEIVPDTSAAITSWTV
jgi:hypothetical protein